MTVRQEKSTLIWFMSKPGNYAYVQEVCMYFPTLLTCVLIVLYFSDLELVLITYKIGLMPLCGNFVIIIY